MRWIAATGLAAAMAAAAAAQPGQGVRPVRIGLAGPAVDGCPGVAAVSGLARNGDNFLAVRARPSRVAPTLDRLGTGREVWLCDTDAVPGWTGIVYATAPNQQCGAEDVVPAPRAYAGPCRQGWVASRYLTLVAG